MKFVVCFWNFFAIFFFRNSSNSVFRMVLSSCATASAFIRTGVDDRPGVADDMFVSFFVFYTLLTLISVRPITIDLNWFNFMYLKYEYFPLAFKQIIITEQFIEIHKFNKNKRSEIIFIGV